MTASTQPDAPRLLIVGPTASGKASVAVAAARRLGGEVLSMDSMKVYRAMDIGTAKPSVEKRAGVPFHLLDLREPHERMTVADYCAEARRVEAAVRARGKVPLFAGGTALYLKALTEGLFEGPPADPALRAALQAEAGERGAPALHARLAAIDPEAAARLHPNDLRRVVRALEVHATTGRPISALQRQWSRAPRPDRLVIGIRWERPELYRRIDERVDRMMAAGFLDEVEALAARPSGISREARQALGYRELLDWLEAGRPAPLEAVVEGIKQATRRFAKRQLTFLRQLPDIHWLDARPGIEAAALADQVVALHRRP